MSQRGVVVIFRAPQDAAGWCERINAAGFEPWVAPLLDFARIEDARVSACLERLRRGDYEWVCITSSKTVRALEDASARAGESLATALSRARVAAVGASTARQLAARGVNADLIAGEQPGETSDARGLAHALGAPPHGVGEPEGQLNREKRTDRGPNVRVLLPASDLAPDTLRTLLAAQGWEAEPVAVYRTVAYPAPRESQLGTARGSSSGDAAVDTTVLTARALREELERAATAGSAAPPFFALLFSSPSSVTLCEEAWGQPLRDALRELRELRAARDEASRGVLSGRVAGGDAPPSFLVLAIGQTTAEKLREAGVDGVLTPGKPDVSSLMGMLRQRV